MSAVRIIADYGSGGADILRHAIGKKVEIANAQRSICIEKRNNAIVLPEKSRRIFCDSSKMCQI
jgi:DNA polymerase III alpha subunit